MWRHRGVFVVVLFWMESKSCLKSGSIKMTNMTAPLRAVSANSSSCLMTWWTAPSTRPIWLFTGHCWGACLAQTLPATHSTPFVADLYLGAASDSRGHICRRAYFVNTATWPTMTKPCGWEKLSLTQSVQHNCLNVQFQFLSSILFFLFLTHHLFSIICIPNSGSLWIKNVWLDIRMQVLWHLKSPNTLATVHIFYNTLQWFQLFH